MNGLYDLMIYLSIRLLAVDSSAIHLVQRTHLEGSGRRVQSYQPFIDQSHLDSLSLYDPVWHAGSGIRVEVDVDELGHQCPNDVQLPPGLWTNVAEMQFHDDHIDVIEVLERESLEARVFSALAVDLHHNIFPLEAVLLDHGLQTVVPAVPFHLVLAANADKVKVVVIAVGLTLGLTVVGAVELVVRHRLEGRDLAAVLVPAFHSDVNQPFTVAYEVLADHVASVAPASVASELAVCILSKTTVTE